MSTELEAADLFDAATKVVGCKRICITTSLVWSVLVPAMLEWLSEQTSFLDIYKNEELDWMCTIHGCSSTGPDLPTALARLVLRVAELEQPAKGEGEKQ